ncbi:MAG: Flp pilus assembly complex ATPase component TadA [Gemmatimonadetes bacterium]|nr:Flp pilus assembly complex ATPase component TadA [Gemmatimonadota bacterium]
MPITGPRILGKLLVENEGVCPEALAAALGEARRGRERIGETLVRLGAATPAAVARSLGLQLGLEVATPPLDPDPDALSAISPDLLRAHHLVPLAIRARSIRIAMSDPLRLTAVDDVQFQTGRRVEPMVTTPEAVAEALERLLGPGAGEGKERAATSGGRDPGEGTESGTDSATHPGRASDWEGGARLDDGTAERRAARSVVASGSPTDFAALVEALPDALRQTSAQQGREEVDTELEAATRRAPVVRLVDRILRSAIEEGASDIHVEETGADVRVRFRIDGRLQKTLDLPAGARRAVLSRIKVVAGMDISVRRRAQDGRAALRHQGRRLTLRVSTLPVNGGEKAVVRILDPDSAPRDLDGLGMAASDLAQLRALLTRGEGVLLSAGPTGSGKSTTLFAALSEMDRASRNVVTVEDPVEYRMPGASQVQVERRAGLGFAEALRAILRQDPDVVMVGEIRDRETAEIAMAAAVTGHLVLSTIHTTDAPGAMTRLLHMGVPPFLVAGGLAGIVAQRLVRRSCTVCRGRGCDLCRDGLSGRTGIYQVLTVSDAMRDEISGGGSSARLRRLAMESGMSTLASDARRAVAAGLTTLHEVGRYLDAAARAGVPCPSCSYAVPFGAAACPRCGHRRGRNCSCGQRLERGWRFCPACVRPATT